MAAFPRTFAFMTFATGHLPLEKKINFLKKTKKKCSSQKCFRSTTRCPEPLGYVSWWVLRPLVFFLSMRGETMQVHKTTGKAIAEIQKFWWTGKIHSAERRSAGRALKRGANAPAGQGASNALCCSQQRPVGLEKCPFSTPQRQNFRRCALVVVELLSWRN